MPINPHRLMEQIENQADKIKQWNAEQVRDLPLAVAQYRATSHTEWLSLEELARGKQAGAMPVEELHLTRSISPAPFDYIVVATDGSAIPPDRHGGMAHCQVQNIGQVVLGYGTLLQSYIESDTRFYLLATDGEHENNNNTSQLLEVQGSVDELAVLLKLAIEHRATVALRDGPLTLWSSTILNSKEGKELTAHYLNLVHQFNEVKIPVVGYTSNSRSDAVITALREMSHQSYGGLLDADLFRQVLAPGEYSAAFQNSARHPKDTALTDEIHFVYLRTAQEMVRLEFSRHYLGTSELATALAVIARQAELGQGYPVALMEAHEQAVLRGDDRTLLRILLEERGLLTIESEKGRSKRLRGI